MEVPNAEPSDDSLAWPSSRHVPLKRDRSFWGLTVTQFLGAFNDNLYKQLILLLAIPTAAAAAATVQDSQDTATVIFALPFVLFSGLAGYLADRFSKTRIIFLSKVAEIAAMGLAMLAFRLYGQFGHTGLFTVLFLMGLQSTFFGPSKYGVLPELFRKEDLPAVNGAILMTTFLAIIFGTVTAGFMKDLLVAPDLPLSETAEHLAIGSAVCLVIALIGTCTSLLIRYVPPAEPDLKFRLSCVVAPPETIRLLWRDRPLMAAILASCMFWLVSGIAIQAVNSLGRVQLQLSDTKTSIMTAVIGLGIAIGSVIAGKMSHGKASSRVIRIGLWGIVLCLLILAISLPTGDGTYRHLLGFGGSLVFLTLLGMSAGFFAIPLQVFIQSRPPADQKGRMIALMNLTNWIAILLSGFLYGLFDTFVIQIGWPRSPIFAMMALLIVPVLIAYRPRFEEE